MAGNEECPFNMDGITLNEEILQELKLYLIKRDDTDLQSVLKSLEEILNQFQENLSDISASQLAVQLLLTYRMILLER